MAGFELNDRRYRSLSIRGPLTLFIIVLVLIVTLTVLWNVVLVNDYNKMRELAAQDAAFHWTFIALGSALFLAIIILSSILGAQLIAHIRWSQRQSNFIASVSHELNSPLSAIKLFAQTMRRQELSTTDRLNFIDKILFDVERLQRLISNILRAAEVDNRGDELQVVLQKVELYGYLRDYLEDARAIYEASDLDITLQGESENWVHLDRMMFRQVLDNIIDNAIRYRGDDPPVVTLEVTHAGEDSLLRIIDHGIGVPPSELPRLFERFYRASSAPGVKRKGTGIGLYVVRSIIEAHGGKVGVFSEGRGKGTTIWIRLPPAEAADKRGTVSS